jgi:hypothetical protein
MVAVAVTERLAVARWFAAGPRAGIVTDDVPSVSR